jgi:predicted nucleic acid-binding protein
MAHDIVVDASVALKWQFKDEDETEQAVAMLQDYEAGRIGFIVPWLFYFEIANAVHIAVLRKRIAEEDGKHVIQDMLAIPLTVTASVELVADSYKFARNNSISFYDAVYLSLAEGKHTLLYTGDKKFFNSVKDKFKSVRWIGDYVHVP